MESYKRVQPEEQAGKVLGRLPIAPPALFGYEAFPTGCVQKRVGKIRVERGGKSRFIPDKPRTARSE
jgi:hypothetical protein